MTSIKKTYTLAEAVEYLKREANSPDLSVNDIVMLAAEGLIGVCFPYRGKLGLFENRRESSEPPSKQELSREIWGAAHSTNDFHGVLRSVSRPTLSAEIEDIRGNISRAHALLPVQVVPIAVFASNPPVQVGQPAGHHWRRVHGSKGPYAETQQVSLVPQAEWLIEAESLEHLAAQMGKKLASTAKQPVEGMSDSQTISSGSRATSRVVSTKERRNTLTPLIEQAQNRCADPYDAAAVWVQLCVMAERREGLLYGVTEDGVQWLKNGAPAILTPRSLAGRIRRKKAR